MIKEYFYPNKLKHFKYIFFFLNQKIYFIPFLKGISFAIFLLYNGHFYIGVHCLVFKLINKPFYLSFYLIFCLIYIILSLGLTLVN